MMFVADNANVTDITMFCVLMFTLWSFVKLGAPMLLYMSNVNKMYIHYFTFGHDLLFEPLNLYF